MNFLHSVFKVFFFIFFFLSYLIIIMNSFPGSCHYLIFLRANSLIVYDLGDSAPTSKAQGLISGQKQRFHNWFVMALCEIKINAPKWETKDELQTNDSYKIRQLIIKIMEYTHIHIQPWAKSKQPNKNTVYWCGKQRK